MADTIIERETTRDTGDSGAGWAVAVIILIIVIVAGGVYFFRHRGVAAPATNGTNINVTIPPPTGNTGNTGQ